MIATEKFPYIDFPFRLEYKEEKTNKICWFECQEHLDKYVERYKLKKKDITVENRDAKPVRSRKTDKGSVEQKPKSKGKGSPGAIRKRKSSMDTTGNTSSNTRKKK